MSSYFPLLPCIKGSNPKQIINGSTTFLNVPNNLRKSNYSKLERSPVFFATYKHESGAWKRLSVNECSYGEFVEVRRKELDVKDCQMVVSLAQYKDLFPSSTRYLPPPISLRIDSSPIAERASLNFHLDNASTTFQGEYPFSMSCLKKGSLWSFDALKESKGKNTKSYLVLMNINRDAQVCSDVDIEIYNPSDPKVKSSWIARQNSFTIIDFDSVHERIVSKQSSEVLFIQCRSCTFIPMILNVDIISKQLSLEHTHPPSELLWGKEKFELIRLIKAKWLSN